jgi:hypothetical protein
MGDIVRMLQSIGSGVEPAEALQHAGLHVTPPDEYRKLHLFASTLFEHGHTGAPISSSASSPVGFQSLSAISLAGTR